MGRKTRNGIRKFSGNIAKIKNIRWIDNDEPLSFSQNTSETEINCTGYPYGKSLVVRIAKAEF